MFQQIIKQTAILIFVLLTIFSFGSQTARAQICKPVTNGLVSWYRAEGDAADAQNSNNGALRNGTAFAPGRVGRAFKFDGADDFVEIADAASLKPQNLTLEAWVKFDNLTSTVSGNAPPGFQYIIFKKNANQILFEGYALVKLPDNRLAYTSISNGGVHTTVVDNTQTVEIGKYYHVVGSYDGTTARLYVNGRKVGEQVHGQPLDYDTRPVTIGATNEAIWDGKMNGSIDEVKIYNRALSGAEVKANYLSGAMLVNCDAESDPAAIGNGTTNHDVTGWENETGSFTVVRYAATSGGFPSVSDAGPADRGAFFFSGGSSSSSSSATQTINLSDYAAQIDTGAQRFHMSGFLGGYADQADHARLTAIFRGAENNPLGSATIGPVTVADRGGQTALLSREKFGTIPIGARSVEVTLLFTSFTGGFNDGYADNVSFALVESTGAPNNLISWHAGDGDARDFTGANNGTIYFGNTKFIVGKVGQAFAFDVNGGGGGIQLPNSVFRGQAEGTIETWVRLRGLPVGQFGASAIWTEVEEPRTTTRFGIYYLADGKIGAFGDFSNVSAISPSVVPQNEWLHVAAVYKSGETVKLYLNGALAAQSQNTSGALSDTPAGFVGIGAYHSGFGDDFSLHGDVDEASAYRRALAASEIQAIYNAGTAGKIRKVTTDAGANVVNQLRDATVTFANVATAGETAQTPLETSTLPVLPQGFAQTGLAYDISTTAAFSGNVDVCFNLPALVGERFSRLRVLHLENGAWVDRTITVNSPQLCARTPSLSPFIIAENLAPTSASVTVGGRVTANGRGIGKARITLTDASGETRTAITNPLGYYRFANVPAGATYILAAQSKQYVFANPTRVLNVSEEITDADFTAQTTLFGRFR